MALGFVALGSGGPREWEPRIRGQVGGKELGPKNGAKGAGTMDQGPSRGSGSSLHRA